MYIFAVKRLNDLFQKPQGQRMRKFTLIDIESDNRIVLQLKKPHGILIHYKKSKSKIDVQ